MKRPDLSKSKIIGFDTETYDPELLQRGTGVYRKDGMMVGFSLSNDDFSEYYDVGHPGVTTDTKRKNMNYLKDVMSNNVPKVAANISYDYDWIVNGYDIPINGILHDIQIAEPLICEYRNSFSLANLARLYLGREKQKTEIDKYCEKQGWKGKSASWIWKMPYETVRPYGRVDAELLIPILKIQLQLLKEQELTSLYEIEMGLIPLVMQMRKVGVRLDVDLLNTKIDTVIDSLRIEKENMTKKYGEFNVKSTKQIAKVFDELGIKYKRNEPTALMKEKGHTIGNPNLDKDALKLIDHELPKQILQIREYRTILNTFLVNSFTDLRVGERLHTNFNPLRSDNYGTVSGRYSSTKPNLQQIPSQEETMGKFCREIFIPEEGYVWAKLDWSQIEYRLIAHYARGDKSELIRQQYINDPKTDYHKLVMDWTGLDRTNAKRLNFGMAYFMGVFTCSKKFQWTMEEAKEFIRIYHEAVPFVKTTRTHVVKIAKIRGFLKTILKRRARISPKMVNERREYSIFNRLIQGSAADLMKKAMYDSYKEGLFNVLVPHLTVHDELDVSVPKTKAGKEALIRLKQIMETCVELRVPIRADLEVGNNWADVSEEKANIFLKGFLK